MEAAGKKLWVIPGGHIPLQSTGKEPNMVSQDRLAILNTGSDEINVTLSLYYSDQDPVTDYIIKIKGKRLKKIRINDLIDPYPVILETNYSIVLEANEPVVVQFFRMNSGQNNAAIMSTIAFGTDH
jgi:hypothetical protein